MSKNKTKINKKDLRSLIDQSTFLSKKDKKAWLFLVPNLTSEDIQRLHKEFLKAQKDEQIFLLRFVHKNNLGNKVLSTLNKGIKNAKKIVLFKARKNQLNKM